MTSEIGQKISRKRCGVAMALIKFDLGNRDQHRDGERLLGIYEEMTA